MFSIRRSLRFHKTTPIFVQMLSRKEPPNASRKREMLIYFILVEIIDKRIVNNLDELTNRAVSVTHDKSQKKEETYICSGRYSWSWGALVRCRGRRRPH